MSLIDDITSKYIIDDLDNFLSIASEDLEDLEDGRRTYSLNVYSKEIPDKKICYASIILFNNNITISLIQRFSKLPEHKGIIKNILNIIICKAHELKIDIDFYAMPSCGNIHGYTNHDKLYEYYNSIGFKRKNTKKRTIFDKIFYNAPYAIRYHTTPANMNNIISSWRGRNAPIENETESSCLGAGCFRKRCRNVPATRRNAPANRRNVSATRSVRRRKENL